MTKAEIIVRFDYIQFLGNDGEEIAYWDRDEWYNDPSLTVQIANAMQLFYTQGLDAVLDALQWRRLTFS